MNVHKLRLKVEKKTKQPKTRHKKFPMSSSAWGVWQCDVWKLRVRKEEASLARLNRRLAKQTKPTRAASVPPRRPHGDHSYDETLPLNERTLLQLRGDVRVAFRVTPGERRGARFREISTQILIPYLLFCSIQYQF